MFLLRLPHHVGEAGGKRAADHPGCVSNGDISAVYKDIPGGQLLGPTYDYTHRLLDFTLLAMVKHQRPPPTAKTAVAARFSARVRGWRSLKRIAAHSRMTSPARRRLPLMFFPFAAVDARRRRRYSLALADSTQRGYGRSTVCGEIAAAISTYRLCRQRAGILR
ncbi:carbon-phosphorus lyase complex subunit PhnI [Escherichia coli]